jgi:hypothetical protein
MREVGRRGKGAQAGPSGSGGARGIQLGLLVKNGKKKWSPRKKGDFPTFDLEDFEIDPEKI